MGILAEPAKGTARKLGREFDDLRIPRRPRLVPKYVEIGDLPALTALVRENIPISGVSDITPQRILAHDAEYIRAFERNGTLAGLYAYLAFNAIGLAELKEGKLETANPPLSRLAPPDARPAALYIWAVVGLGLASEVMCHLAERMRRPHLAEADVYSVPATAAGARLAQRLGFEKVACRHPHLLRYRRRSGDGSQIPIAA